MAQVVSITAQGQTRDIDPLVIRRVPDAVQLRVTGKFTRTDKFETVGQYLDEGHKYGWTNRTVRVTHIITLDREDFETLETNLLTDYGFLSGLGGADSDYVFPDDKDFWDQPPAEICKWREKCYTLAVMVQCAGRSPILVNPEGNAYARSVGWPGQIPEELGMLMHKDV